MSRQQPYDLLQTPCLKWQPLAVHQFARAEDL